MREGVQYSERGASLRRSLGALALQQEDAVERRLSAARDERELEGHDQLPFCRVTSTLTHPSMGFQFSATWTTSHV